MNIIGLEKNKRYFDIIIKKGLLAHAYIFDGPDMIGKKLFALELYKKLNNSSLPLENDPDLKVVRAEEDGTEISIAKIRELKSFFSLTHYKGPYRMAIIDDAHGLSNEASNALLKILEEPPAYSLIILVTSRAKTLVRTIVSRCEHIAFKGQSALQIEGVLAAYKISKADKELFGAVSANRVGLALKLADENNPTEIRKAIGGLEKVVNSSISDRLQFAKKIHEKGDYVKLVELWLNWCYEQRDRPAMKKILVNLLKFYKIANKPEFNQRLAFENFLLAL